MRATSSTKDKTTSSSAGAPARWKSVIVDEYTGRKMTGRQVVGRSAPGGRTPRSGCRSSRRRRRWRRSRCRTSQALQGALGMTGTAQTRSRRVHEIYKLEVVTIPTNRPVIRQDNEDRVYRKEREKWEAIIDEIKAYSDVGRRCWSCTTSVEKSEIALEPAQAKVRRAARRYSRQAARARSTDRRARRQQHVNAHGETVGNRHDRHQHGPAGGTDIKPAQGSFYDVASGNGDEKYVLTPQRVVGKQARSRSVQAEDPLAPVFQLAPARSPSAACMSSHRAPHRPPHRQSATRALRAPGRPCSSGSTSASKTS